MKTRVRLSDCDGFTSSALLWNYIKQIFPNADLHFLLHEGKEHGIADKIDFLIDEEYCDLLIAPDAASYDVDYFWQLNKIHTDVIALDHHTQQYKDDGTPIVNDCPTAIVVNNQLSPNYPNKDLCGAGVTYQFCRVLDDLLGIQLSINFIDFAAIGNIGDVMFQGDPETRYIIIEGLRHIINPGLRALIESQSYSLKDKATPPFHGLTPIDVAFYLCPLINATVRAGTNEEKEVLFTAFIDPYKELPSTKRGAKVGDIELAAEQAARITKNIKARQDRLKEKALDIIDFKIQKEALNQNNLIVVEITPEDNIPNELTGLLAQNIVSKYNRPAFVVRRDYKGILRGSARNNGNFQALPSLKAFLESTSMFDMLAGHENAHGLAITEKNLHQLLDFMNSNFSNDAFTNCYLVDYILSANDTSLSSILTTIATHQNCYGNGIDEPRFIIKDITLEHILVMGNNKDSIKISYKNIDYVHFKDTDFIDKIMMNRGKLLTVYGRANLNEFMGKTSVQVFIDDYELVNDSNKYDF